MAKARKLTAQAGWGNTGKRVALLLSCLLLGSSTAGIQAAPTVAQMLSYRPRQEGVNYTTPTGDAVNACTVELIKGKTKGSGWLLRDKDKLPLRWFFDTNDDNKIDIWSYFKDGVEVYREIDTTFSGKPDQYRWLNTGGMKWGIDEARDGTIKTWKAISPEEVSQEVLQALVTRNYARLQALLITEAELKQLELPADMVNKIREQQKNAPAKFQDTLSKLTKLGPKANWLHLETGVPRCIPADQIGSRSDLIKHMRGTILYDGGNGSDWLQTGEMIQVSAAWRLVDAPVPGAATEEVSTPGGGPGEVIQKTTSPEVKAAIEELAKLDGMAPQAKGNPDPAMVAHHLRRADLLEKIVGLVKAEERDPWIRQVADSLSTAAQASAKGETVALTRLFSLEQQLVSKIPGSDLAAYVTFREMQADYSTRVGGENFTKVQQEWMDRLAKFVQTYPKAEDTPDALLQLGMVCEFLSKEVEAKNWYAQLVKNFANAPQAKKAEGSIVRLNLEGKVLKLAGPMLNDSNVVFDVDQLRGKVVIVYYWAGWNSQSVGDFAKLKLLLDTFGKQGVDLVCINLDNTIDEARTFLRRSPAPGTHLYQTGGMEGKLATDYGVMVLPQMFLIGKDGKVVSKSAQINSVEDEVKKQLK
jgi:hypothetical protein